MAIRHTKSGEVLLGASHFPSLIREVEGVEIELPLRFAHQFQLEAVLFIPPQDPPVGIVIADDLRDPDLEVGGT